jgi:hypothetical protein
MFCFIYGKCMVQTSVRELDMLSVQLLKVLKGGEAFFHIFPTYDS